MRQYQAICAGISLGFEPSIPGQMIEGVPIEGDISFEMVDNVNVHFGNPNSSIISKDLQPWMMLSFRELVSNQRQRQTQGQKSRT